MNACIKENLDCWLEGERAHFGVETHMPRGYLPSCQLDTVDSALLTSTNTEIGQLEDTVHRTKLSTNSRYMELRRLKLRLVTALDENKSDGAKQTNLRRTMPAGGERRHA